MWLCSWQQLTFPSLFPLFMISLREECAYSHQTKEVHDFCPDIFGSQQPSIGRDALYDRQRRKGLVADNRARGVSLYVFQREARCTGPRLGTRTVVRFWTTSVRKLHAESKLSARSAGSRYDSLGSTWGRKRNIPRGLRRSREIETLFLQISAARMEFFLRPACCRASHNETPLTVFQQGSKDAFLCIFCAFEVRTTHATKLWKSPDYGTETRELKLASSRTQRFLLYAAYHVPHYFLSQQ